MLLMVQHVGRLAVDCVLVSSAGASTIADLGLLWSGVCAVGKACGLGGGLERDLVVVVRIGNAAEESTMCGGGVESSSAGCDGTFRIGGAVGAWL